jgi:hypothetical protein
MAARSTVSRSGANLSPCNRLWVVKMKTNLFILAFIILSVFKAFRGFDYETDGPAPIIGMTVLACCIISGIFRYHSQRP